MTQTSVTKQASKQGGEKKNGIRPFLRVNVPEAELTIGRPICRLGTAAALLRRGTQWFSGRCATPGNG
jgi:hypothetical protein